MTADEIVKLAITDYKRLEQLLNRTDVPEIQEIILSQMNDIQANVDNIRPGLELSGL